MNTHAAQGSAQAPLKMKGLQERLLLQAESMFLSSQLQNFGPLRDSLLAAGQDAAATYRQLKSRRDELVSQLTNFARIRPALTAPPVRPDFDTTSPLTPPAFVGTPPAFGFAGSVGMGPPNEFGNIAAPGVKQGAIQTLGLYSTGLTTFAGDIAGMPVDGYPSNPGTYNPKAIHLWMHSWYYRVPFPAPPVLSMLTYSFEVFAQAAEIIVSGPGFLMFFVTVGETANFVGQDIPINTLAGLPFAGQLTEDSCLQSGSSLVQRSFAVNGGNIPAIELVVGVVAVLPHGSEIVFDDQGDCYILPRSTTVAKGIYIADLAQFRYDPIKVIST